MTDHQLPHDPYITAVTDALTAANLEPADAWTSDAETRGTYCYLDAVITLDPDTSGLDADRWPHGLLLIWEWHTGIEADQGEPERGPAWLWAALLADGSNTEPALLPVDGYANPVQVAAAFDELVETGEAVKARPGRWCGADALDAACEAWGADEADE